MSICLPLSDSAGGTFDEAFGATFRCIEVNLPSDNSRTVPRGFRVGNSELKGKTKEVRPGCSQRHRHAARPECGLRSMTLGHLLFLYFAAAGMARINSGCTCYRAWSPQRDSQSTYQRLRRSRVNASSYEYGRYRYRASIASVPW